MISRTLCSTIFVIFCVCPLALAQPPCESTDFSEDTFGSWVLGNDGVGNYPSETNARGGRLVGITSSDTLYLDHVYWAVGGALPYTTVSEDFSYQGNIYLAGLKAQARVGPLTRVGLSLAASSYEYGVQLVYDTNQTIASVGPSGMSRVKQWVVAVSPINNWSYAWPYIVVQGDPDWVALKAQRTGTTLSFSASFDGGTTFDTIVSYTDASDFHPGAMKGYVCADENWTNPGGGLEVVMDNLIVCAANAPPDAEGEGEGETRSWPSAVYPIPNTVSRTPSEIPFTESGETLTYGFDAPFPNVPRQTFVVEDYGGAPDGTSNNTAPFTDALAAAIACGGPAEVVFSSTGHYLFLSGNADYGNLYESIITINGATNLLIRGQGDGTVLVSGDPQIGLLLITNSHTVKLQDFSVDYNPLPFTQGTVTGKTAASFGFRIDAGYPELTEINPTNVQDGYRMGTYNGYTWPPISELGMTGFTKVSTGVWDIACSSGGLATLGANDRVVYSGRRTQQHAVVVNMTKGFWLENVNVHSSVGVGLCFNSVENVSIRGYADAKPAGSTRLLATCADATFSGGVRGGITIRDSYFNGQGDDCINLHGLSYHPTHVWYQADKDDELYLTSPVDADIRAGDYLEFFDAAGMRIKGQIQIIDAVPYSGNTVWRVWLASGVSSLAYDWNDWIYLPQVSSSNFKIVHNFFGQNRGGCMRFRARDGLVQANTVTNGEGYGVTLDYGGAEGLTAANVTIRNNVFRNVTNVGGGSVITVYDGESAYRNFRNIRVENNQFDQPRKLTAYISGADGVTFAGNVAATAAGHRFSRNDYWYPVDCSLYLYNDTGVLVNDYSLDDLAIRQAGVYIDGSCAPGNQGVTIGTVDAQLATGVPVVLDLRLSGEEGEGEHEPVIVGPASAATGSMITLTAPSGGTGYIWSLAGRPAEDIDGASSDGNVLVLNPVGAQHNGVWNVTYSGTSGGEQLTLSFSLEVVNEVPVLGLVYGGALTCLLATAALTIGRSRARVAR